jgi:membrane-bound serine protease (ClpP class)
MIFLIIAFVLFVLDIKAPTHGALTIAGVGSFIAGGLILFNSPGVPSFQRVSVPLVVGASIVTAAVFFVILTFAIKAQRRPVNTGREALVGKIGIARTELNPEGTVQVGGELWSAEIMHNHPLISSGSRVEILQVQGIRIIVKEVTRPVD